ncbi:MAG: hypothetical protein KC615_12950 [Anaerolineae bacterium]|nr:hypothetical protein [Anaerolineae bacterium]MCA9893886.1 hypothetical protein [Anaerolineae bacterium]
MMNNGSCEIAQASIIDSLVQEIVEDYPVRDIRRGLDSNSQQITAPITEAVHLSVLENLRSALRAIDAKYSVLGKSIKNVFDASEEIDIALDYFRPNSSSPQYSGITPAQIPNLMRLGNLMLPEHIVHEWGHALDRKDGFRHSGALNNQGIITHLTIPSQATISVVNQSVSRAITGIYSCLPAPVGSPVQVPPGTLLYDDEIVIQRRIISGRPPEGGAYQRCLVGYGDIANDEILVTEDWADVFMNWVYDRRSDGGNAGFDKAGNQSNSDPQTLSGPIYLGMFGAERRRWIEVYARGNL